TTVSWLILPEPFTSTAREPPEKILVVWVTLMRLPSPPRFTLTAKEALDAMLPAPVTLTRLWLPPPRTFSLSRELVDRPLFRAAVNRSWSLPRSITTVRLCPELRLLVCV